jgi:hypothetical protein
MLQTVHALRQDRLERAVEQDGERGPERARGAGCVIGNFGQFSLDGTRWGSARQPELAALVSAEVLGGQRLQ